MTKYRLNPDKVPGLLYEGEIGEGGKKRETEGRALPRGSVVDSAHITLLLTVLNALRKAASRRHVMPITPLTLNPHEVVNNT